MAYAIFPTSPLPAALERSPIWGENVTMFDSGVEQASTPYSAPLYRWGLSLTNVPRSKQSSLHAFWNACRGRVVPFLFSDPYDNRVNGAVCAVSGTTVQSFYVRTAEGYPVIPVSGTLLITSQLSGALTQGTHYQYNGDTGVFSAWAKANTDIWTASCQYFRKCKFDSYQEQSQFWEIFSGKLEWHSVALP